MKLTKFITTVLATPAIISTFATPAQSLTPPFGGFPDDFSKLNIDDYLDIVSFRPPLPPLPCPPHRPPNYCFSYILNNEASKFINLTNLDLGVALLNDETVIYNRLSEGQSLLQLSLSSSVAIDEDDFPGVKDLSFIANDLPSIAEDQNLPLNIIAIPALAKQTAVPERRSTTVLILGFLGAILFRQAGQKPNLRQKQ